MYKLTTLALVAGLATVSLALPSQAQFLAANIPGGPSSSGDTRNCADDVGHARRVAVQEIDAIHGQRVWLQPVCEDMSGFGRDDYGTLFLDGNANTLREPIAGNPTLMAALTDKGYDQHDVVSVVFGANDSILLYVHQRDYR